MQGYLADKDGPARLVRYAGSLADEHEFELLIERTIKNYLADRARQTEHGRLYRRIDRVLTRDPRFTLVGRSSWSLAPSGIARWSGGDDYLVAAARRALGELPPPPSGSRAPGAVSARELADICFAVLRYAAASVPIATIVLAVADALRVKERPVLPLTEREVPQAAMTTGLCRLLAEDIWERLSPRERLLLPHLSGSARQQAAEAGMGHSQAAVAAQRLKERLRVFLDGEDARDQEEILSHLLERQAIWLGETERIPDG